MVKDKNLLNDLKHLAIYTGRLEVYHSLIDWFCPKHLDFSCNSMISRTEHGILDHNSGTDSEHTKTKYGEERFKLPFGKVKKLDNNKK